MLMVRLACRVVHSRLDRRAFDVPRRYEAVGLDTGG